METLTKAELAVRKKEILQRISNGEIFIHPTDTIYGLGCSAMDNEALKKIRKIKNNHEQTFTVWAPNKKWIEENCELTEESRKWLDKLPGPYTLILKIKNKKAVAPKVNPKKGLIAVRIPNHWFSKLIEVLQLPIVTTAVNKLGEEYMTSLDDVDRDIQNNTQFCVYEGEKRGKRSQIIRFD